MERLQSNQRVRCLSALLPLTMLAILPPALAQPPSPGESTDHRDLPELSIALEHRIRYEVLDGRFRAGRTGGDQILNFRTLLHGRFRPLLGLTIGGEFMDARAQRDDRGTPISTSIVNTAELLQAYLELSSEWPQGLSTQVRAGRLTMDIGSRRLVGRNRFRNTINAFTGIDATVELGDGQTLRAFYVLPIERRPKGVEELRANEVEFDSEDLDRRFWGLFYKAALPWDDQVEAFLFGLNDEASKTARELYTPGFRLLRAPGPGGFDYVLETALQFGEHGGLDHFAFFQHAEVGYTAAIPWSPRLAFEYDHASGDGDPNDGDSGQFDTLFGPRRFDFGPTGIYGPFVRANLISPGLRLTAQPGPTLEGFVAYRGFWLAESRGEAGATGLQDPTGEADRFMGSQLELRLRWAVIPDRVRLEVGGAHLFPGAFLDDAPGSSGQGATDYGYTQISLSF